MAGLDTSYEAKAIERGHFQIDNRDHDFSVTEQCIPAFFAIFGFDTDKIILQSRVDDSPDSG